MPPRRKTIFYKQGHFWGIFAVWLGLFPTGIGFGVNGHTTLMHWLLGMSCIGSAGSVWMACHYYSISKLWSSGAVLLVIVTTFGVDILAIPEQKSPKFEVSPTYDRFQQSAKFGGFEWRPEWTDTRVKITNGGNGPAENIDFILSFERDGIDIFKVFELSHIPGVATTILGATGAPVALAIGSDGTGSKISGDEMISPVMEVGCALLDAGRSITVVLATARVAPKEDTVFQRAFPDHLRVRGHFDKRTSGGLERVLFPDSEYLFSEIRYAQSK